MTDALTGTMRCAVYRGPGDVVMETRPIPRPGPGELLLRMEACGICGSDVMDWYTRDKAPAVLGHEPIGVVVERGAAVDEPDVRPAVGDRVFVHHHVPCFVCTLCLAGNETLCRSFRTSHIDPGGFSEYIRVPAENARRDTLRLPDHVSTEAATLIEPLACVLRGQRRAGGRPGGITAVIGLGQIGLLHVVAIQNAQGGRIAALDPVATRLDRATALGAMSVGATAADFRATFGPEGAAIVHVATGAPEAIETALEIAGEGAVVQLFAPTRPGATVPIEPHSIFFRELTIQTSYSAGPRDTRDALRLISGGAIDPEMFITHRFSLDQTAAALEVQAHDRSAVKVLVSGHAP